MLNVKLQLLLVAGIGVMGYTFMSNTDDTKKVSIETKKEQVVVIEHKSYKPKIEESIQTNETSNNKNTNTQDDTITYQEVIQGAPKQNSIDKFQDELEIEKLDQEADMILAQADELIKNNNLTLPKVSLSLQEKTDQFIYEEELKKLSKELEEFESAN